MDAVSLLNDKIDLRVLLEYYRFENISEYKDGLRCSCKIHGGDNPTAFVVRNNLWFCHTGGCGGGDAYNLVMHMEGITFKHAVSRVAQIMDVDINGLVIAERKESYLREIKEWIAFMKKRLSKSEEVKEYVVKADMKSPDVYRRFEKETVKYFGLRFANIMTFETLDGRRYDVYDRFIIPIHNEHGVQIGISTRATREGDTKWIHQPPHIKTSNMLYNYDRVRDSPLIVVCEGIFDVWAFHEIDVPAVCTYGAHLSDAQYELLIKSGADVVLAYDGDDAGRKARDKAIDMLKNKVTLSVIDFESNEDPESIPRSDLRDKIHRRRYGV